MCLPASSQRSSLSVRLSRLSVATVVFRPESPKSLLPFRRFLLEKTFFFLALSLFRPFAYQSLVRLILPSLSGVREFTIGKALGLPFSDPTRQNSVYSVQCTIVHGVLV